MEKIKLDYNTVKGIFERMFFSSISGSSPLSAEVFHSFSILTIKQMLTMQDLAIRCKKYENAYNKISRNLVNILLLKFAQKYSGIQITDVL